GDPEPALWMVHAGELLARRSDDLEFLKDFLYPKLESIVQSYRAGTRGGIRVGTDGLLAAGEGARAIRSAGLNALWYHALVAIAQLARVVGRKESGAFYLAWAREHQKCFHDSFWDVRKDAMIASLSAQGAEITSRPDQLLAISLRPSILTPERARCQLERIERELVTPALDRPGRASAIEWLPVFLTAYLRTEGRGPDAQARVRGWLEPW